MYCATLSASEEVIDKRYLNKGKHAWWYGNHEVHSTEVLGPFVGHRDDQFIVQFQIDVTPHGAERNTMTEVGVFTIAGGKIVQEEFLYLMG